MGGEGGGGQRAGGRWRAGRWRAVGVGRGGRRQREQHTLAMTMPMTMVTRAGAALVASELALASARSACNARNARNATVIRVHGHGGDARDEGVGRGWGSAAKKKEQRSKCAAQKSARR